MKKVILILLVLIVASIGSIPVNQMILSERMTFETEEEMKLTLQGSYTRYNYLYNTVDATINILDDTLTINSDNYQTYDIEKWNYKRGIIKTSGGNYVVTKSGDLESHGGLERKTYLFERNS